MKRMNGVERLKQHCKPALVLAFAVAMLCGWVEPSFADASQCYQIQDQDRKNLCLALAKEEASYCYQLRDSDTKNVCLAQVKGEKSYCYQIREADLRSQCLSLF